MPEKLTEHVWFLPKEDDTYCPALGYVCSGKTSVIIDAGNSPDHVSLIYGSVRSVSLPDPEYAILTHCHWDHVFGLSGSPAKAIASSLTNQQLIEMQHYDWTDNAMASRIAEGIETPFFAEMIKREMPMRHSFKVRTADITFGERCKLRLNDIYCEMHHVGGCHSQDSVVVYIPEDRVLFLGDCYMENVYYGDSGAMQYRELERIAKTLDSFDAEWFIPSHGEPTPKKNFMEALEARLRIGRALTGITDKENGCRIAEEFLGHPLSDLEIKHVDQFTTGNGLPDSAFALPPVSDPGLYY